MNKQTGLEFMRTASAEEIAKVISEGHPPVGSVHCDCTPLREVLAGVAAHRHGSALQMRKGGPA